MVLSAEANSNRLTVYVDPAFPNAWREEPYYGTLKKLAHEATDPNGQVVVHLKKRVIVVLPDKDVDLGELAPGDRITVGAKETSGGLTFEAHKISGNEALSPTSVENRPTRSKLAGRSDLIRRAMAADARRAAVFHDIEQALNQLRASN